MNNETRWTHGTYSPEQVAELATQEHSPAVWKLINTITNLQGVVDGVGALAKQQARQLEGFHELHALEAQEGGAKWEELLKACDKAGLMTDSMRATWLPEATQSLGLETAR